MKLKNKKIFMFICTLMILLSSIMPDIGIICSEVFAATDVITYHGSISYGGSTVGNFTINGSQAFCIEHSKNTPPSNTQVTSSVYDDENIGKCLYYGWKGEGQWSGFTSENMGIVVTSLALDYFYNNKPHYIANDFINFINSQSLPKKYLKFSNSNLTAYKDGDRQRTETITLEGDPNYSIIVKLQDNVTLYNETKGTAEIGSVTVHGGESFYLSSPIDSGIAGRWESNNIGASTYKFSSIIWVTRDSAMQDLAQTGDYIADPNGTLSLAVNWLETGGFIIKKTNTNGDGIEGVAFKIWNDSIGYSVTKTTDSSGIIVMDDLLSSTYYIQEQTSISGYLLNSTVYTKNVNAGDNPNLNIVTIQNEEPTGTIQVIKKSEQGDLIKGTVFKVTADEDIRNVAGTKTYYTRGQLVGNITTDSNGLAEITNLPLGKYVVEEIEATNGYLLDSTKHNITLSYKGQTEKIVLESIEKIDTTPTGEIKVYKTDKYNNKLKGAEISLYAREDIKNVAGTKTWYKKGDLVATAITNEEGIAIFSNLHLGSYYVKETNAPAGYLINNKEFDAVLNYKDQTTKVIYLDITGVIDEEPTGTISIKKEDSKTGSVPQGDAVFTGAVYKVYSKEDIYNKARTKKIYTKGDLIATRTMSEEGQTEDIIDLPLGKYIVKEETAPIGYMLDTKEYEVNLEYKDQNTQVISNSVTSLEKVKEMGVHIFKSGIKENSGETPGLEGAEFTIKLNSNVQRAYEKGYTYSEVWNGIDEDGNKVNVDSNRVAQAQIIAPTYEIIKTDSDGNAYTQNKLPYGKYIVKETKTPTDYETATDFTFSITNDETEINEVAKKIKHIVVNNEQLETYIKLIKKDLKTGKIVTLNSATFEIKAAKDIYDRATNKILYKKGEPISQKIGNTTYTSFTTNADNIVVPDNSFNSQNDNMGEATTPLKLPVGSYEITEINVPDGFLQMDKPITFDIKNLKDYDTDNDGDFLKEVVILNDKPTGSIYIDKIIELKEDADISLIDVSDLSGIEFKLFAKEDIIDKADGSIIYKKGQEINKYNLTKDGKLTISELPLGIYEIVETKTVDGLVLNTTKYEVKFEQKDFTTKVYIEKLNISNDTTLTEFSKTDVTGDKELIGATLTVTDSDGKIVDKWVSGENTHKIEGLKIGEEYTLKEEIAPDGYVIATEIKFIVNNTNEIQKVNMKDKIVSMSKKDIGGEEVEGAKIQIIDKDGNIVDEWISTKEEHKINNLIENETYTLHEETAPNGFVKTTDITFEVTDEKTDQHIELIDKIVEISKEDISGKEIDGAKLQVLDLDGNVIDEWTSGKEAHKVTGLEENKTYKLHEEVAVGNYVKASDIEFKVTTDKNTQKIVMIDKLVEITKTDLTNGEELEGAELIVTDEDGNIIDEWTSTKEPHQVVGLEEGKTYILTEITSPYGYEIAESITFTITKDKQTQVIEMKDMPILKNIRVVKLDSQTNEVIKDKFTFGLYEDRECTKTIQQMDSNIEDGTILFEEVRFGTYYIKEVSAPEGYQLSDRVVEVIINENGVFIDGEEIQENDQTYSFEFYNTLIPKIQTGNETNYILLISSAIISILGIVVGLIILKRRK